MLMEKSSLDPSVMKKVEDRLYEDSKRRERELQVVQSEIDRKAKEDSSRYVHGSSSEIVKRLYQDMENKKKKEAEM